MATAYYVFIDKFIVPCNIDTAYDYISNIEEYPRWWGKIYKRIITLQKSIPGEPGGKYKITIAGFLPYTLTIENEVTNINKPHLIRFDAGGDLQGKGEWIFREVAEGTEITFDWKVAANKKIIRWFSFLLKPLFKANHAYCVRKAKEGMTNDLQQKEQLAISYNR